MAKSRRSLQVVYYLCLFYLGNLITSLFLRNFTGEMIFVAGITVIMVALFQLSRIQGYDLKGGCICFIIAFALNLLKVPENMALYLMMGHPDEEYVDRASAFVMEMRKWQIWIQVIAGISFILKLAGWILWMHSHVFVGVKKMFYFFFADLLIGMVVLGVKNIDYGSDTVVYLFSINAISYIIHILALIALGITVYRLRRNIIILQKSRNYAFVLCFLTGSCYLPFLFVGYMSYQIFLLIACIFLLYGIKSRGLERKCLNVFYWWLCTGVLIVGMIGYRMYCSFTAVVPQLFYAVFVIWGMVAAGYGIMEKNFGKNKRVYRGLCVLSVLLIPLTLFYLQGTAFFIVAVLWAWIWLPLWVWCLDVFIREYFQSIEKENNGYFEGLDNGEKLV